MKSSYIIVIIAICFSLNSSCSKSPECWGSDKNKGLIEKNYTWSDYPAFIQHYVQQNDHLIIIDTTELLNILDSTYYNQYDSSDLWYTDYDIEKHELIAFYRDIDFKKHSLLGFWAVGKCEADFIREVEKNEAEKKYIYSIKVKECGWCMAARIDPNVVLIPRIEDDYSIVFEYK